MFIILLLAGAVAVNAQCEPSTSLQLSVTCGNNQTVQGEITSNLPFNNAVEQFVDKWRETCEASSGVTVQETSSGYQRIEGLQNTYKVHNIPLTWDQGRSLCEKEGAHMVVFDSQEEADAVFQMADCCPWVGVYRANTSSPWITVLGDVVPTSGYTGWVSGYPVESGNCNMIFKNKGIGMINWICAVNMGVVCEKPANYIN